MSKVDAQRAMREARYARTRASGPTRREEAAANKPATAPAPPAPSAPPVRAAKPAPTATAPEGERCGHTSMNGRSCTRAAAHPEKSHRYS